jgi:hypothetical protein
MALKKENTFRKWVEETYQTEGRKQIYESYEQSKEDEVHNYSITNFDRAVRRIIRDVDGYNKAEHSYNVQTLDQALEFHNVDLTSSQVKEYKVATWGSEKNPNTYVSAKLVAKEQEELSSEKKANIFLDIIKSSKDFPKKKVKPYKSIDGLHGVISIVDAHFGLENWGEILGEKDYTVEEAKKQYLETVESLLSKLVYNGAIEFSFPQIGDLLNVDNIQRSTTKGTPQYENCDPRKAYRIAQETIIEAISMIADKGKVYIPVVSGNHDELSHDHLFLGIEYYFANNPNVIFDTSPTFLKSYSIKDVGIMIAHGNGAKHYKNDLPMAFASQFSEIWGKTKIRICLSGHLHHLKVLTPLADENNGVRTYILPALVPANLWHKLNFYNSRQGATALLIDPSSGETAQFFHNIV